MVQGLSRSESSGNARLAWPRLILRSALLWFVDKGAVCGGYVYLTLRAGQAGQGLVL